MSPQRRIFNNQLRCAHYRATHNTHKLTHMHACSDYGSRDTLTFFIGRPVSASDANSKDTTHQHRIFPHSTARRSCCLTPQALPSLCPAAAWKRVWKVNAPTGSEEFVSVRPTAKNGGCPCRQQEQRSLATDMVDPKRSLSRGESTQYHQSDHLPFFMKSRYCTQ